MAMKSYAGIGNVARKVKKQYEGVAGVARKRRKSYEGVAGIARQYFTSDLIVFNGGDSVLEGELLTHRSGAMTGSAMAGIVGGRLVSSGCSYAAQHPSTGQVSAVGFSAWCSIGPIDLSDYSTLHANGWTSHSQVSSHIGYAAELSSSANMDASVFLPETSEQEVTLDVSDLRGEYYLIFSTLFPQQTTPGYGYISKIWFD